MKIYQSYLGELQRAFVSPLSEPVDVQNNTGNDQREYELLRKIYAENTLSEEPWGLVSWKFQHKSLLQVSEFLEFANEKLQEGFDCVFINPMIGNEALYFNAWEQGIHCGHAGMDEIYKFLNEKIDSKFSQIMDNKKFAMCNYFIGNKKFWSAYFSFVENILMQLEKEVSCQSKAGIVYASSASYARDTQVTMRPFVIERLFSNFIAGNSAIKYCGYSYTPSHYQRKFGEQLGTFLHDISCLKERALLLQDNNLMGEFHNLRRNILLSDFRNIVWNMDDPSPFFLSDTYLNFKKSVKS